MAERMLIYPQRLVESYGAKAGLLMHVGKHLPDIPQMPMVVSEPGESTDAFLARVGQRGFSDTLLFRSSAIAELDGYEGDFPTKKDSLRFARATIDEIRYSTQGLMRDYPGVVLPNEINVIAAELSPSRYAGTYIKHPNREGEYLTAVTAMYGDPRFRLRGNYHSTRDGINEMRELSQGLIFDYITEELEEVHSWHNQISTLPEMDPNWSYQIEFGLDPQVLYQVRPFKPKKSAQFQLRSRENLVFKPLVIGITPQEGLEAQAVVYPGQCSEEKNVDFSVIDPDAPKVIVGELRDVWQSDDVPHVVANILGRARGFLAHQDVKAMRRADVTVLYSQGFESNYYNLTHGEYVNIVSDGRTLQIR